MHSSSDHFRVYVFALRLAVLLLGLLSAHGPARAAEVSGGITGQVSNAVTRDYLEGATVTIAGTDLLAITDREGRYFFHHVPVAPLTLVVSFAGLDVQRIPVSPEAGRRVVQDVALNSTIYQMDRFTVSGEREGAAKAETLQRQAANVKSVISADTFGNRADANIANLLENVAGVNALWNDAEARQASIRGVAAEMNTVTLDGQSMASSSAGANRRFDFDAHSLGNIERIEVTKAATPDMEGAAVGGNVNLVTRSAFDRKADRIFTYAAGLTEQPTFRAPAPNWKSPIGRFGPFFNLGYTGLLGEKQNLGVTFTGSYHNIELNHIRALLAYGQNNPNPGPTFISGHTRRVAFNNRTKILGGLKADYRWSDATVVSLALTYNLSHVTGGSYQMAGSTPTALATIDANGNRTGGGFVSPNYTDGITRLFPATNAAYTFSNLASDTMQRTQVLNPTVRHRFDKLEINYGLSYSDAESYGDRYARPFGSVTGRLPFIGYTIDRRQSLIRPVVRQTEGPDMYNLDNYTGLQFNDNVANNRSTVLNAKFDLKRDLPLALPTFVKTGLSYNRERRKLASDNKRYNYTGPDGVAGTADDNRDIGQFLDTTSPWLTHADFRQYFKDPGGVIPFASAYAVARHVINRPELWDQDIAFGRQSTLQADRSLTEEISGAYLMGNVRIGRTVILAGLRVEGTSVLGEGPLNYISPLERARRAAWVGPVTKPEAVRRAEAQFGNRTQNKGKYHSSFPSIHFRYEPFDRFVTRLSWSVGIGRPAFGNIMPNDTVSDDARTVTHNNPGLKPQFTDSYDWTAEYYFKSQGMISFGLFRKDIKEYIFTDSSQIIGTGADNGFNGEYAGYTLTTQSNRGSAKIEGVELAYSQQLTFLPGWTKGFGVNASWTVLRSAGNYGAAPGSAVLTLPFATTAVQSFLPRSGSAGLSYRGYGLDLRLQAVYRGQYLYVASTNVALLEYRMARTMLNWKSTYNVSRTLGIFLDVDNLNSAVISDNYLLYPDRRNNYATFAPKIQAGVSGRF